MLSSENERIRFEHPLMASVIYGSASAERRRQLHKRLALVVSDPEERARHLALCTTEPEEEIAAELEAAAALAARRGAPEAAAELFSAAKRLTPLASEAKLTSRGLGEATALLSAGDVGGARKIASEAAAAAPPACALRQNCSSVTSTGSPAPGHTRSSTWRTHLRPNQRIRRSRRAPTRSWSTTRSLTPRVRGSSARSEPSRP